METQTMTLTDFLLARLREDEVAARAASDYDSGWPFGDAFISRDGEYAQTDMDFVNRFNPLRALAEVAAKRRIVERHGEFGRISRNESGEVGVDFICSDPRTLYDVSDDCADMRALAAVYADHPDYRPEWKS